MTTITLSRIKGQKKGLKRVKFKQDKIHGDPKILSNLTLHRSFAGKARKITVTLMKLY